MKRVVTVVAVGFAISGCTGERSEGGAGTPTPVQGRPGVWSEAAAIHDLAGSSVNAAVVADAAGNALAVWEFRPDGNGQDVGLWASRFTGSSWSAPVAIANGYSWVYGTRFAGNAAGHAIVAWGAYDGDTYRLLASRFTAEGSWTAPETLATDEGDWPQVAIDDAGHALVVWRTGTATVETLHGRLYEPEQGWRPAAALVEDIDLAETYWGVGGGVFDLALDPTGGAVLAWAEEGTPGAIRARRAAADPGSTGPLAWQQAESVASLALPSGIGRLWAGVDGAGGPTAIWARYDDDQRQTYSLAMSRADGSGPWESETLVAEAIPSTFGFFANEAQAAIKGGAAVVLWREVEGENPAVLGRMLSRVYAPASGWGPDVVVASDLAPPMGCTMEGMAEAMDLAVDESGRIIATWEIPTEESFSVNVAAREYVPGAGWSSEPSRIDAGTGSSQAPSAAVSGEAGFVVWTRQEEVDGVWTQRLWSSHVLATSLGRTPAN